MTASMSGPAWMSCLIACCCAILMHSATAAQQCLPCSVADGGPATVCASSWHSGGHCAAGLPAMHHHDEPDRQCIVLMHISHLKHSQLKHSNTRGWVPGVLYISCCKVLCTCHDPSCKQTHTPALRLASTVAASVAASTHAACNPKSAVATLGRAAPPVPSFKRRKFNSHTLLLVSASLERLAGGSC